MKKGDRPNVWISQIKLSHQVKSKKPRYVDEKAKIIKP